MSAPAAPAPKSHRPTRNPGWETPVSQGRARRPAHLCPPGTAQACSSWGAGGGGRSVQGDLLMLQQGCRGLCAEDSGRQESVGTAPQPTCLLSRVHTTVTDSLPAQATLRTVGGWGECPLQCLEGEDGFSFLFLWWPFRGRGSSRARDQIGSWPTLGPNSLEEEGRRGMDGKVFTLGAFRPLC